MITECWTPQSSHRDTFFSIYTCYITKHTLYNLHAVQLLDMFIYSITDITPGKAVVLLSDCGFNFKSNWSRLTSIMNVPVEVKGKMRAIIKEDEAYELQ